MVPARTPPAPDQLHRPAASGEPVTRPRPHTHVMLVEKREHPTGAVLLTIHGEIDAATSPALERRLRDYSGTTDRVVLDLREVTFLSVHAITMLTTTHTHAASRGTALQLIVGRGSPVERALLVTDRLHPSPLAITITDER
jgi:anti-anti-sigma factor